MSLMDARLIYSEEKMEQKELPPLEYDAKFDGYGFFDPRGFWEMVVHMDRDRQTQKTSSSALQRDKYPKGQSESEGR
jgi:hypothetical protein